MDNVETLDSRQQALVLLGAQLNGAGYRFLTPTPATHLLVNGRAGHAVGRSLADIFGWSRPFSLESLPGEIVHLCRDAGVLIPADAPGLMKSTVRWSSFGDRLFVHSAFPTDDIDAVFFGPDSYRFAALLERNIGRVRRLVDVGCGTGVGALSIARRAHSIVLADINPRALWFAKVNAHVGGEDLRKVEVLQSDVLAQAEGSFDAIVANPPYLADERARTYRDGGGTLGLGLCSRITRQAVSRLVPGGRYVLYTGTPIIEGIPLVCEQLEPILLEAGGKWIWELLDPDVFSEELSGPAYQRVDQLAVYGLIYQAP